MRCNRLDSRMLSRAQLQLTQIVFRYFRLIIIRCQRSKTANIEALLIELNQGPRITLTFYDISNNSASSVHIHKAYSLVRLLLLIGII